MFFILIWCDFRSLASMGTYLIENWTLQRNECQFDRATTKNDVTQQFETCKVFLKGLEV